MSSVDEIYQSLPLAQIAQQVGANESDVQQAAAAVLPALLGGLQANAQDPAGAASIEEALGQHDPSLVDGGIDVAQIDQGDGQKIASHIFGQSEDQVVNALGGLGGPGLSSPLVKKLIPILAPIVMAYLAKQVFGGTTAGQQQRNGGGALGSILGSILGGGAQQSSGGGLGDVLGQVLGGGQQSAAPQSQQAQSQPTLPAQTQQPQAQQVPAPQQSTSSGDAGIDAAIDDALGGGQSQQGAAGTQQTGGQQGGQGGIGDLLGSVLGGMLGGGRR